MSLKSFRYVVKGDVQDVGFRHFTKRMADKEGIVGWVKNDPQGDVVGVAQGHEKALARFQDHLATGPRYATVADVEISAEKALSDVEFWSFEIRH